MTNPWHLTPRECECMDAMNARGTIKAAARALGIEADTLITHLRHARQKMNPPHKLGHFLEWHLWRWKTQQLAAGKSACIATEPSKSHETCDGAETSGFRPIDATLATGGMSERQLG